MCNTFFASCENNSIVSWQNSFYRKCLGLKIQSLYWRTAVPINVWNFFYNFLIKHTHIHVRQSTTRKKCSTSTKWNAPFGYDFPKIWFLHFCNPKVRIFPSSKGMTIMEKHWALCLGYGFREQWQKVQKRNRPCYQLPWKVHFWISQALYSDDFFN